MKRKTYVRRGAIILAVMMLVSLCGMLPTAALLLRRRKPLRCRIISSAQSIQR